jgi:tRNA1(Val) A37 N6-methylase TrmN6
VASHEPYTEILAELDHATDPTELARRVASSDMQIDEHLLGHIFESSRTGLGDRKHKGIFYTSEILSTFLATSALDAMPTTPRILDPACGAGAFLLAAHRALLDVHPRTAVSQRCLFGSDLLARAVAVAKLALWIRSARSGEQLASLDANLVVGDSLDVEALFERLGHAPGSFDLVIGNPPWGARLHEQQRLRACELLGLAVNKDLDSWEIFLALGLHALRPGGRLAFVLPDTLFSPEKAGTRKLLLEHTKIEKLHNLGPDWFGADVRMGTVIVQAQLAAAPSGHCYRALLLHGEQRRQAIEGQVSLTQLEADRSRRIPQARSLAHHDCALEVFRDELDDQLMQRMDSAGETLSTVCARARGEEMAKSGLLWKCTSCDALNNPGAKAKGGGFKPTQCKQCGISLDEASVEPLYLVTGSKQSQSGRAVPYIDGDDLPGRYKAVDVSRWLALDSGFKLKSPEIYAGPKILLRQAGVGIAATLDDSDARCPQSVYVYRVRPAYDSWTHEYVLAALLSRAMAYYVFKRFSEVDPARAHAKLTHERLANLPIPRLDLRNERHAAMHRQVCVDVRSLLDRTSTLGGEADWRIESAVRDLYGLSARDGQYIDRELSLLPRSQAIEELFPERAP